MATAFILAVSSCGFFGNGKTSDNELPDVKKIGEFQDSIKDKIKKQDTLMTELVNKVDTLTKELNSAKAEIAQIKGKINSLEEPQNIWRWISLSALALSAIALILAIIRRGLNEREVCNIASKQIEHSDIIKNLSFLVSTSGDKAQRSSSKNSQSSVASNLDSRLRQIEKRIKDVETSVNEQAIYFKMQKDPNSQLQELDYHRMGYAKLNSDDYFTSILDSNQEGCVFAITFKSENEGEFSIISLDKIKSTNGWQKVVEYTGVIDSATRFELESKGKCEKKGNEPWKVTKPLKIRLLK